MYAKHFGLTQDPFSIAPDPRYLFMSERHREALAHLLFGLGATQDGKATAGGGFVLLSGEIGTGKTTVCRCLMEQVPAHCHVAYIFNPKLTAMELLRTVCDEFHVQVPPGANTAKDYIDALNAFLLATHAEGKNCVLIIDEAQNLAIDVLEQLRLLTNLETNTRKLLQIVLIGQPELRTLLAQPALEQLAQRVLARFHLDALSEAETRLYVAHRLSVAGLSGSSPFQTAALHRIYQLAGGIPRRINLLCGRAMLGAYSQGLTQISRAVVDKAAREVFGPAEKLAPARALATVPTGTGGAFSGWLSRHPASSAVLLIALGAGLAWVGSQTQLVSLITRQMGLSVNLSAADSAALRLKHSAKISPPPAPTEDVKAATSPPSLAASAPASKP